MPGERSIVLRNVTKEYRRDEFRIPVLVDLDLTVDEGEFLALMGPSGSGKSTLMHALAGLDPPTGGSVAIAGTEITGLGDAELTRLRREHIGFVFQFFNLLPMLTAEENAVLPLTIAGERPDRAWLDELFARTGLSERRSHRPAQLSGGEQQRVAITRALVSRPTIVFADEPTGNLDSRTSGEILELLRESAEEYGQTMVMVTHDPLAAVIADRILFLADGEIVQERTNASSEQVLEVMSTLQ
jgi:putative ABC transport system ATP-binding protein